MLQERRLISLSRMKWMTQLPQVACRAVVTHHLYRVMSKVRKGVKKKLLEFYKALHWNGSKWPAIWVITISCLILVRVFMRAIGISN